MTGGVPVAPPARPPLIPGRARGILYGGCASLLAATGAPHGRSNARGGLLVIEVTGEEPHRLDGILTRLLRSGALEGASGVVCGSWQECGPYEKIRAVLADRFAPLGVPVIEELGFGHGPTALTVPLGAPAVLNAPADGGRCALTVEVPALLQPFGAAAGLTPGLGPVQAYVCACPGGLVARARRG